MCGIIAIYNNQIKFDKDMRAKSLSMSKKVRHRGPDWSGIYTSDNAILAHERLSIVDIKSGKQPLFSSDKKIVLTVNGEIYNHQYFRDSNELDYHFQTNSDCEVIIPLFNKYGHDMLNMINGIFAFVLYDKTSNSYFVARDPIGVFLFNLGKEEIGTYYFS